MVDDAACADGHGLAVLCLDALDQPIDQVDIAPEHARPYCAYRIRANRALWRLLDGHAGIWLLVSATLSWTDDPGDDAAKPPSSPMM
jgi:hypothetical protein